MYQLGIEAFIAIVQSQSFSRAAELLHLSQATISHRIKVLEQELGCPLMQRRKGQRSIRLTLFGEEFVSIAERWNNLMRETNLLQKNGPLPGLAIGAVDSVSTYLLPPLYRALSQHTPSISLQIGTYQSVELYTLVECKEIDVAFVLREILTPNVIIKPCFNEQLVVVRVASSENLPMTMVTPDALSPDNELYVNWSPSYQIWHDRIWNPCCASRIRLDNVALIAALLSDPKQWAIVPMSIARSFSKTSNLVIQPLSDPPPDRTCYLISHRHKDASTANSLEILDSYIETVLQSENPI